VKIDWSNKSHEYQTIAFDYLLSYSSDMQVLTNQDIPAVLQYIAGEKEVNLFIEGDIELYGLESDVVNLYAFGDDWDCLVLRFYENFLLTSNKAQPDLQPVVEFLKKQTMLCLSAKESLLLDIQQYFPANKVQGTYLCRLNKQTFKMEASADRDIVKLGPSDAQAIIDLYKQIEEFAKPYIEHESEKLKQTKETYEKGCLGFGIFNNGQLVCMANIAAKTQSGAMIIGVATHPSYRKRGYASQVMSRLCSQCFTDGLSFLCLFYSNPLAGAIYHRLGFETIGRWGMMKF